VMVPDFWRPDSSFAVKVKSTVPRLTCLFSTDRSNGAFVVDVVTWGCDIVIPRGKPLQALYRRGGLGVVRCLSEHFARKHTGPSTGWSGPGRLS